MSTFSITNLNDFATILRKNAYEHLSMTNIENLDEFITVNEVTKLVSHSGIGFDDDNNIIINEDILEELINDVSKWIYDISLSKLCGNDKLDCAWDDQHNEMVFWSK
jgi:hypothetical protein